MAIASASAMPAAKPASRERTKLSWKSRLFRALGLVMLGAVIGGAISNYATRKYDAFAYGFEQAQECLAQVTSVEGNVLDETGQRYIMSVVLNRTNRAGRGDSWFEDVCIASYAKHFNKKLDRHFLDFSGLEGRTPFDDYSRRYGWDESMSYAFAMLVMEQTPFKSSDRLPEGYLFYFSEGVDIDWFQRANGVVCDVTIPYLASAKARRLSLMYFCRLKDSPAYVPTA